MFLAFFPQNPNAELSPLHTNHVKTNNCELHRASMSRQHTEYYLTQLRAFRENRRTMHGCLVSLRAWMKVKIVWMGIKMSSGLYHHIGIVAVRPSRVYYHANSFTAVIVFPFNIRIISNRLHYMWLSTTIYTFWSLLHLVFLLKVYFLLYWTSNTVSWSKRQNQR